MRVWLLLHFAMDVGMFSQAIHFGGLMNMIGDRRGMSAATRLRRLDESAEIVVFERGPYVSYASCGLAYYVGGVIADRSALLLGASFAVTTSIS